jgi:hypothetical protein
MCWWPQISGTHIRDLRQFESMYTLQGKPDQHVIRIPRSFCVWSQTICISRGQRIATFHKTVNNGGQSHCSQGKVLPTQSTACQLTDPWLRTQFLFQDSHWSSDGKATLCWWQATRLTGPISLACDWYVQYFLAGANLSVLNRHRRGYNHLRALPSLRLSNLNITSSEKMIWSTYRWHKVFRPLDVYRSLYLRLAMTNVLQLLKG